MEEARKKKKRIPLGRIIILCLMLPAAYVGLQVYRATNVTYAYETAVTATMSDTMEVQGAVLFDETAVEGGGELGYLVADGERVSAGTRIAERYTDDAQAGARAQVADPPAPPQRREAAQHQQACVGGQEGFKGVLFGFHVAVFL